MFILSVCTTFIPFDFLKVVLLLLLLCKIVVRLKRMGSGIKLPGLIAGSASHRLCGLEQIT